MAIEFSHQGIPFVEQPELRLRYGDMALRQTYRPDFICFDEILVEIKAVERLHETHEAQLLNYLNATGRTLGILVNFGTHPRLDSKRIALS